MIKGMAGMERGKPTLLIRWNQIIPNSKRKSDRLLEGKRGGVKGAGKEIAEWSVSRTTENMGEYVGMDRGTGEENKHVTLQYLIHFGITAKKTKKNIRGNCRKAKESECGITLV
jgi:hypothetical protein